MADGRTGNWGQAVAGVMLVMLAGAGPIRAQVPAPPPSLGAPAAAPGEPQAAGLAAAVGPGVEQAQMPGAPVDIRQPANEQDDLLLLYRHTVYNNYAALAFGEACSVLTATEIGALRGNIEKLAVDFRDRFAYNRDQWFGMVQAMEQRYQREEPDCSNRTAQMFSQDVSRDIVALNR